MKRSQRESRWPKVLTGWPKEIEGKRSSAKRIGGSFVVFTRDTSQTGATNNVVASPRYFVGAFLFFLARARRSVFLRRAARFLALVLPWLCPIRFNTHPFGAISKRFRVPRKRPWHLSRYWTRRAAALSRSNRFSGSDLLNDFPWR